ncbi:hypothetical protein X943_000387 [Babesia divergens]|uniref:Uncharacterized protein n=1 Tax=Babesia divergens TaxID=32595 RepID=A0AAD9GAD0_BABDI|nr:hypothetical protein X943_000387 [Babesia divergens]
MDCFSGSVSGELLDITSRYFTACNLSSYVLPLPFCDESLLDRHAVLSKVLANSSCISKDQLFGIIQGFSNGRARVSSDYDNFSHSYDLILPGKRWNRQLRKAPSTTTGIRTTLRQSKTALTEKLTAELSSMHETDQIIDKLDSSLRSLWEPHTMGFVMIIAARSHNRNVADDVSHGIIGDEKLIPIAGGIVDILDPEEHSIKCVWCDPKLTNKDDSDFGKMLILRLLGHLFDYGYPGSSSNNRLKHTSVLNVHGILFPTSIYTFMINGLKFGKHFETQTNGGSHEDTSSNFCRCQRLEDSEDAELFWGISESRLRSIIYNMRSQLPLKPSDNTMDILQGLLQQTG